MKKVAIFVEGQTDSIFIKDVVLKLYNYNVTVECRKVINSRQSKAFDHICPNPNIFFKIFDVGNDGKVIGAIKENIDTLSKEYELVIGVRDMYSGDYDKLSKGKIDINVNKKYINTHQGIVVKLNQKVKTLFFFSIMELEAWILAMPYVLTRISTKLKLININTLIKDDICSIDPEKNIFKPSKILWKFMKSGGVYGEKSFKNMQKIVSKIKKDDYIALSNSGKVQSFKTFIDAINNL